jgi:hypothetical protein
MLQRALVIPRPLIAAAAAILALVVALVATASAATTTVTVYEVNLATSGDPLGGSMWFFYNDENDTIDNSLGSFVEGPDTAPLGQGSAQISVSGTQRRNLATYQFSGTPLADITTLAFSTYNPSAGNPGSPSRSAYLNFNVDFDGTDTWQRRLAFVPSLNGTVVQDTWQEWDAIMGGAALWLYSGPTWPGTVTPGTTARTWADLLTSYPGIRIRVTDSWLGLRVGEPYADGYTENLDAFKFGTASELKIFDFEPGEPPQWVVAAKIGGGNTLNPFLPDYTPGTWATKWVGVYLDCVPGTSPIAIERKDSSQVFRDGIHTYSTKPTDECVDEAGHAAEPIVDWGPIMVDTKAPACRPDPSTHRINRNSSAIVEFVVDVHDDTSGWALVSVVSPSEAGGADLISVAITDTTLDSVTVKAEASMGSSTAGRIDIRLRVIDNAGLVSECTLLIRAR